MKSLFTLMSLIFFLSTTTQAQYYPGQKWERKSAKSLNLNQVVLDSAVSIASQNENAVNRDLRIAIINAFSPRARF